MRVKTIFLDIDGVLYPCLKRTRCNTSAQVYRNQLKIQFPTYNFEGLPDVTIQAVCEGWDKDALRRVKRLCMQTKAVLVITSSWKLTFDNDALKAIFHIVGLDDFLIGKTKNVYGIDKEKAIQGYIKDHPEIINFVILDDQFMMDTFPQNSVLCPDIFDEQCYEEACRILQDGS